MSDNGSRPSDEFQPLLVAAREKLKGNHARLQELNDGVKLWCSEIDDATIENGYSPDDVKDKRNAFARWILKLPDVVSYPPKPPEQTPDDDERPKTPSYQLTRLSDVTIKPVEWLWRNHLAMGKVHLLDGDPGNAKSLISLDWASRITTGEPFPGEYQKREPASAIILTTEDAIDDTVTPRCEAAGANLDFVHAFVGIETGEVDALGEPATRLPAFPGDAPMLETIIRELGALLVILDVLVSYAEKRLNVNDGQDIRTILNPLVKVAERTGCAIVALRHLNKDTAKAAMYRGAGSVGITGVARTAMLVGPNPDDRDIEDENERRRVLAVIKNNVGRKPSAIDYKVAEKGGYPVIEWGNLNKHGADALLGINADDERDEPVRFLREFLRDGPRFASEIELAAKEEGLTMSRLNRAKRRAGVVTDKEGQYQGRYFWSLKS